MTVHIGELTSEVVARPADPPGPVEEAGMWTERDRILAAHAQVAMEHLRVAAEDGDD